MSVQVTKKARELAQKFDAEWGGFRRWLAMHPLTGFWAAVVGAGLLGYVIGRI